MTDDGERFSGRVGVVIPARNEGGEVVQTVRSARASKADGTDLRFYVVDDASTDGCCDRLRRDAGVALFRNETAQGEARNRNRGSEAAFADGCRAAVVLDAHMRVDTRWGMEQLAIAAERTKGLVCGVTHALDPSVQFTGCGGRWRWVPFGEETDRFPRGLRLQWNYDKGQIIQPVDAVYGASYAMTAGTFAKLGGWMDTGGAYGYGEQALCLAAWFLGVGRFCHTQVHLRHKFRAARPYPMSGAGYWANYARCNRVLFGAEEFDRTFRPLVGDAEGSPEVAAALADDGWCGAHDALAARKVRSDAECLSWLGIARP